jgi:BirA family transcriptional regulator, biotin operon repressor / biotin---[acetyl-CoA-carboxylase] ligase
MELAHQLAAEGAAHGSAVVAERQRAGRGQRGRSWESGPGGLWMSVVLRPSRVDAFEALSLRIGLALAATLERACPGLAAVGLKWPNDLFLRGRKVGGILTEARWVGSDCQWVVVGLGLNVTNILPPELEAVATTLAAEASDADVEMLLAPVLLALQQAGRNAGPLSATELEMLQSRDVLRETPVREPVVGIAAGIAADGALLIRRPDGATVPCRGGVVPGRP